MEDSKVQQANYSNDNKEKNPEEDKKKFEKVKKEIEQFKDFIVKKYKDVISVGILPPQSIPKFIEEEEAPVESKEHMHLIIIFPDEKTKEIPKIKIELIAEIEKLKEKIWIHPVTLSEIWEICTDQKFELSSAISMAYPLYDTGILGALRVTEIHKSLVLQKFEKYIVSYCIGGSLVRGDTIQTSDVDVFIIINDTDVKRMPRRELLERLRGIIYQYVAEATQLAGVENRLEPQIYLLTDFWDSVKDAHPIIFTFIRDGIPIYDRGTFMPWKALLKMGRLKPSPEAIDMFMSMGDNVIQRSKHTLLSDVFTNIFWGITTPAQAILMLNGCPPPTSKELVKDFKKEFYETKMIEKKYIDFLEKVIKLWKDYEHERIEEISGKEIDKLLLETEDYLNRLKQLRTEIEKKAKDKTVEKIYDDAIGLLKNIIGKKSQTALVEEFDKEYVKKGKFTNQHLRTINEIIKIKQEYKKGKTDLHKIDLVRKNADTLMKDLTEFIQRKEMNFIDKRRILLKFKDKVMELLISNEKLFLIDGTDVKKITDKIENSKLEEIEGNMDKTNERELVRINPNTLEIIKKEFGDFEIILE